MKYSGIKIPEERLIVSQLSKINLIHQNDIKLMIDDGPLVIEECLKNGVDCILISTDKTPYNHKLRNKVETHQNVKQALIARNLIKTK